MNLESRAPFTFFAILFVLRLDEVDDRKPFGFFSNILALVKICLTSNRYLSLHLFHESDIDSHIFDVYQPIPCQPFSGECHHGTADVSNSRTVRICGTPRALCRRTSLSALKAQGYPTCGVVAACQEAQNLRALMCYSDTQQDQCCTTSFLLYPSSFSSFASSSLLWNNSKFEGLTLYPNYHLSNTFTLNLCKLRKASHSGFHCQSPGYRNSLLYLRSGCAADAKSSITTNATSAPKEPMTHTLLVYTLVSNNTPPLQDAPSFERRHSKLTASMRMLMAFDNLLETSFALNATKRSKTRFHGLYTRLRGKNDDATSGTDYSTNHPKPTRMQVKRKRKTTQPAPESTGVRNGEVIGGAAAAGTFVAALWVIQKSKRTKTMVNRDVSYCTTSTGSSESFQSEEDPSFFEEYWKILRDMSSDLSASRYSEKNLKNLPSLASSTDIFRWGIARHLLTDSVIPYPSASSLWSEDESVCTSDLPIIESCTTCGSSLNKINHTP